MKKPILIVLGVVLTVVLAAVVFEVIEILTYEVPTVRVPSKTAYVVAYDDGFWFEVGGDVNAPTAVGHDAGTPIPADYDVVMATGWIGTSLDQFKENHLIKMRIPEAGVDLSYDREPGRSDSGAYGGGATHYDQYWVKLLFPITGFKPPGESQVYASHWWVPLTDTDWEYGTATNLTADKKLPQGTYTVYYEETIEGPMTGLDGIYDGQKTPYHAKPGTNTADPYTFTVGPPMAGPGPAAPAAETTSSAASSAGGTRMAVSYARPPLPPDIVQGVSASGEEIGAITLYTVGWQFTPTVDVEVTDLGCFDADQDGLALRHRVGIFTALGGRLLAKVTVGPGSTLDGAFRWERLTAPVVLKAGRSYVVGTEADERVEVDGVSTCETLYSEDKLGEWAPEIVYEGLRTSRGRPGGFAAPTDPKTVDAFVLIAWMSPNFKFVPLSASSSAP